ncbi:MAG TPA: MarC family protein [Bacteroidaceae bacterium]|mgnify:CR=1 FL=1|nr:MarC family protein [Bacteroidaceae bacterium]
MNDFFSQFSFSHFDVEQFASAFIVLFAVIDIIGSIPIIINLKQSGRSVNATQATLLSFGLMLLFFFAGDIVLRLFNVDIRSFAVAGAIVIFLMALEMLLDVEIFKNQGPIKEATLVPLVFPLLAGAGSFTTLLSLKAEYATVNILIALILNMIWVYVVISLTDKVQRVLGTGGIYLIRKFFGIILIAISVRLITENFTALLENISSVK